MPFPYSHTISIVSFVTNVAANKILFLEISFVWKFSTFDDNTFPLHSFCLVIIIIGF